MKDDAKVGKKLQSCKKKRKKVRFFSDRFAERGGLGQLGGLGAVGALGRCGESDEAVCKNEKMSRSRSEMNEPQRSC